MVRPRGDRSTGSTLDVPDGTARRRRHSGHFRRNKGSGGIALAAQLSEVCVTSYQQNRGTGCTTLYFRNPDLFNGVLQRVARCGIGGIHASLACSNDAGFPIEKYTNNTWALA